MPVDHGLSSPHRGRLYALWAEPETIKQDPDFEYSRYDFNDDILLAYSDNDGGSWSKPLKINDDRTAADQVYPAFRIDDGGRVHVAFLDRRANPAGSWFDVYYALVVDGQLVGPNLRVNEESFSALLGGRVLGDYLNMVATAGDKVYVAYPCGHSVYRPTDACVAAIDPGKSLFFERLKPLSSKGDRIGRIEGVTVTGGKPQDGESRGSTGGGGKK